MSVCASYCAAMVLTFLLAVCLTLPVEGPVVAEFAPSGHYSGHWGVDIATRQNTPVLAPSRGVVTFAGRVAGVRSVTIAVGDDVRVSLSYLATIQVSAGESVESGSVVGTSGLAHGRPGVHLSVRVGDTYVDPGGYLRCRSGTIRLLGDR